jgi:hypothetical protein
MAITVATREEHQLGVGRLPRLVSPLLPEDSTALELRSDSVIIGSSYFNVPQVCLVLLPQGNASRRIYYGLPKDTSADKIDHPNRLPRLIITYRAPIPADRAFSEPSVLALTQSDGRQADSSLMASTLPLGNLGGYLVEPDFELRQVTTGSLTRTPAIYRSGLYVVRKEGATTYLQQFSSIDGTSAGKQIALPGDVEVRPGSLMVVDRFGRLRIITNDAILETTVDPAHGTFTPIRKIDFAFSQVPRIVIPGQDGTLYIVQNSIYALNPDVGQIDAKGKFIPSKLWDLATANPDSARITLNPDGTFLYALGQFKDGKSRFRAINAQTGQAVPLNGGIVNTSGKTVTWVSGMDFERISRDQTIPIGDKSSCHVVTVNPSSTRLTCRENFPNESGVQWAAFPDNLTKFRNPVVAKTPKGDFVYITGASGSYATLWGVRNEPAELDPKSKDFGVEKSLVARFTGVWNYTGNSGNYLHSFIWNSSNDQQVPYHTTDISQPILDTIVPGKGEGLSQRKLCFLDNELGGPAVVDALNGKILRQYQTWPNIDNAAFDENPVADKDGLLFWSSDKLYIVRTNPPNHGSNFRPLRTPTPPQLLFGANGSLFAADASTVNFLSPKPPMIPKPKFPAPAR